MTPSAASSPAATTLLPASQAPTSAASATAAVPAPGIAAAARFCETKGGIARTRQPMFGTNGPESSWVDVGAPVTLCEFTDGEGESATRLYVDLNTLYSRTPTLAALAYLSKTPVPDSSAAEPSDALCAALGGSTQYGTSEKGGGLVDKKDAVDPVVSVCAFPDGSFIDAQALSSYSADTVRGVDLATLFRFDPSDIPGVFTEGAG